MASQVNYIDSADGAERNAAARMRELGFADARTTGPGIDAGIDVVSNRALGQVKWRGAQVGRPELQQFYGARGSRHDQSLLFFSATGYSKQALAYADDNHIATFTYDPLGRLTALNSHASAVVARSEADKAETRNKQSAAAKTAAKHQPKPTTPRRPMTAKELRLKKEGDMAVWFLIALVALFFSGISSGAGIHTFFNLTPEQEWNLAASILLGVSLVIALSSAIYIAVFIKVIFATPKKKKQGK